MNPKTFKRIKGVNYRGALFSIEKYDHRLYCTQAKSTNGIPHIVLLNGWIKDKSRGSEENRNIQYAIQLALEAQVETQAPVVERPAYAKGDAVVEPKPEGMGDSLEEEDKKMDKTVTVADLVSLSGVDKHRVQRFLRQGIADGVIPKPRVEGRHHKFTWSLDEVDSIQRYLCAENEALGPLIPKPTKSRDLTQDPTPAKNNVVIQVMTRKDLLRMAENLINSYATYKKRATLVKDFVREVSRYHEAIREMEAQLARMRG